ncbi:redox-sensitive transcriptional activator SoxR, partial [Acinetobacter baumannii]|uniref:MerR family DNA-binding protein n=1 Tax=Acinetobacter baumannii TaxID=470 RepID=UPI0010D8827A
VYKRPVLRYIAYMKIAQRVGSPVEAIKQSLSTFTIGSKITAQQSKELSLDWRKTVDERIQKLTRFRDEMYWCIGCDCLSLE